MTNETSAEFLLKRNLELLESRRTYIDKLAATEARLKEAEKVIEFYADRTRWWAHPIDTSRNNVIENSDYYDVCLGGRRAAEYFKPEET